MTKKSTTPSPELRSEKVQSIVGEIPPALIRHGISIIGIVGLLLVGIAHSIPYQKIYSGVATLHTPPTQSTHDSITLSILLRFHTQRMPSTIHPTSIQLLTPQGHIEGTLLTLSPMRNTLGRQTAHCQFAAHPLQTLPPQEVDFRITHSSGSLLQHLIRMHP